MSGGAAQPESAGRLRTRPSATAEHAPDFRGWWLGCCGLIGHVRTPTHSGSHSSDRQRWAVVDAITHEGDLAGNTYGVRRKIVDVSHTPPDRDNSIEKCAICDRPAVKGITYTVDPGVERLSDPIEMRIMPICKEHAAEYDMLGGDAFFDRHPAF